MKKVKFIYNPSSGETAVALYLDQIVSIYQSYDYTMTMHRLSFEEKELNILLNNLLTTEYDHILIAGGDGTINFVINLLMNNSIKTPISILPTGTANDFATLFNIPTDIEDACHAILKGEFRDVDLGLVNGSYFVNVFSCGLFTDISQKTPTIFKNTFGKLAYYVGGISDLPKFRKLKIKIESDGGNYEGTCLIFFVFNGKTAGQFKIASHSKVDDGMLDVLIFKSGNPFETLQTIFHYFSLFPQRRDYPKGVVHIACKNLKATSLRDENTDIDGQAGPNFPLSIECVTKAIKILVP